MQCKDQKTFIDLRNKIVDILREGEKIEADGPSLAASALNEYYAGFRRVYFVRSVTDSKCIECNLPYNR